jgi:hypothetical protein
MGSKTSPSSLLELGGFVFSGTGLPWRDRRWGMDSGPLKGLPPHLLFDFRCRTSNWAIEQI